MNAGLAATPLAGWSQVWMDTLVTIQIAVPPTEAPAWQEPVRRAFASFAAVEAACSRFDPASEVAALATRTGKPVAASPVLLACLRFALVLAEATGGVFDPTVGARLEAAGFDRCYRTGRRVRLRDGTDPAATWQDVHVDRYNGTVTLDRPVLLDLGAVAKGLAVDLAAAELAGTPGAVVNAGGDAYLHGTDPRGEPWPVGVADPRGPARLLTRLWVRDQAVASSAHSARTTGDGRSHLLGPDGDRWEMVGATVVARTAMLADGLATAVMLLGSARGLDLIEHAHPAAGLLVTADGRTVASTGFAGLSGGDG
jgi:thiamine biosynthesis lipoprotein